MTSAAFLSIWTVYDHPADYPNDFVARRWEIVSGRAIPTPDIVLAPKLDVLRAFLPPGLTCLPRARDDDANIVESWI